MTHEHMHKDEDGTIRHGECRGALVLKAPEHVNASPPPHIGAHPTPAQSEVLHNAKPLFPKSLRYTHHERFLPGLRRKAMSDQFDPNGTAVIDDMDNTDDEFAPPADEDQGSGMKAGAEAHHGVNDILMQAMQFIEDADATVDNATAKKTLSQVGEQIRRALAKLHAGHGKYLEEHPDQPELPGAEGVGPDEDMDGDDDEEDDLDDDMEDDDIEDDEEGDYAEGDDEGGSKDKPKKKKKDKPEGQQGYKAAREWRTKAVNAYWEDLKAMAVTGDGPVVKSAYGYLRGVVKNTALPLEIRKAAKVEAKSLASLITKEVKPVVAGVDSINEDW